MGKTTTTAQKRDDTARIVAQIHGVSTRYVEMVRNGDRKNEEIMATLIDYSRGKRRLIEHLETLVPITPNPAKYARKKN